jgi:hypothetical protein
MGGYRDDLGAAVARADALQRRVDELESHASLEGAQLRILEDRLAFARAEIRNLRKQVPLGAPSIRRRYNPLPVIVLGTGVMCLTALGILWTGLPSFPTPPGALVAGAELPRQRRTLSVGAVAAAVRSIESAARSCIGSPHEAADFEIRVTIDRGGWVTTLDHVIGYSVPIATARCVDAAVRATRFPILDEETVVHLPIKVRVD